MLGLLQIDGYDLVREPDGADFVVVNTCGFIERARTESFAAIDEMLALKEQGKTRGVIVSRLPGRAAEGATARRAARDRSPGRRVRPRRDHARRRSAGRPSGRAADRVPAGADPGAVRPRPPADHAAALCLSEDLRRLRPALHVLRDSQDARQARQQADRGSRRRGRAAGRRRRARTDHRRPGHDLLRPGPVRRAAADGAAAAAGGSRRASTGFG